jgi:hypothetical protein
MAVLLQPESLERARAEHAVRIDDAFDARELVEPGFVHATKGRRFDVVLLTELHDEWEVSFEGALGELATERLGALALVGVVDGDAQGDDVRVAADAPTRVERRRRRRKRQDVEKFERIGDARKLGRFEELARERHERFEPSGAHDPRLVHEP